MEYELAEEDVLLDRSNNPSLDRRVKRAGADRSSVRPENLPSGKPAPQKAELIPEEADRS